MINPILKSPRESVELIAALFGSVADVSNTDDSANQPLYLSVREDVCFGDKWLKLGEIALKPDVQNEEDSSPIENAIRYGFYEWKMEKYDNLQSDCLELLGFNKKQGQAANDNDKNKTRRALESIIDVCRRTGLLFPRFDANIIASLPFRRPTTVVVDTSAIIQGGVDFLIRFLCPMARLKIPAIVAMEILNQSDNYFSCRRESVNSVKKQKPNALLRVLFEHVKSQAGQRAMLRFELNSDIEIERTPLFSDPLRIAFKKDVEKEFPDLKLSAPQKSFCDRLILETARQHISTVSPGHPVMLMTGDEGQARMALAEGIQPFFFHAGKRTESFGKILTGTRFHPFSGEVFSIPLQNLLWESAVTFGCARIATEDGDKSFEVFAIDKELSWQPFHAKDDLLRVKWSGFELQHDIDKEKRQVDLVSPIKETPPRKSEKRKIQIQVVKPRPKLGNLNPNTIYHFDLNVLFTLISELLEKKVIPFDCDGTTLQGKTSRTKSKYINFMHAGGFIAEVPGGIQGTDSLQQLWDALIRRDLENAAVEFRKVPSFTSFLDNLNQQGSIKIVPDASKSDRPSPAYVQIAEICGLALQIPKDAIYSTYSNPMPSEFVDIAFSVYDNLRKGEDYILTGLWLETLAREHQIHPINARNRLNEAQASGMIERFTQGSTPDTRFDEHTLTVLDIDNNHPKAIKVYIYRGDFIIPGKASVSIRLERKENGT